VSAYFESYGCLGCGYVSSDICKMERHYDLMGDPHRYNVQAAPSLPQVRAGSTERSESEAAGLEELLSEEQGAGGS
jgi:hypothetical protein